MSQRRARRTAGAGRFSPAHGAAAKCGKTLVWESVPDGVRSGDSPVADPIETDASGRFTSAGARTAARRRHELARLPDFARKELEFTPTETFAPFDQGRRELLAARASELVQRHGFVSPGVMTVLRGWSWMIAFAECAAVAAAKTDNVDDQDRARRFFKDASIELAKAHELARVEAAARPKRDPFAFLTDPEPAASPATSTTSTSSKSNPLAECNVESAIDKVDGPTNGGAT